MRIPIVFSTDHNFVMQTGVCIFSLLKAARDTLYDILVIINDDVSEDDRSTLQHQVLQFPDHSIRFINIGTVFDGTFEIRGVSKASYSRLLIPWLFPEYEKVIYSDVDIIFKLDLSEIFSKDISDYYFAAVQAFGATYYTQFQSYVESIGLNSDQYVNAGFLIVNCKKQRDNQLKDKLLSESRKKHLYQDQDILNLVCKNHIKIISPQYNLSHLFYVACNTHDVNLTKFYENHLNVGDCMEGKDCIIHYAGPKPWKSFTYAWSEWWDAYKKSVFYDPEFELQVSGKILNPTITWRTIASYIKRKLLKK